MVNKTRLFTTAALVAEEEAVYATLESVFVVGYGVEVETNKSFAIPISQAREEILDEALLVVRMGTEW